MSRMRMSQRGLVDLIADEGEVLRAYRCPAGVWTIGVGLTAASGVVAPTQGMTITRERSRELLSLALERNYEPSVRAALGTSERSTAQHVFDAATSFHFNTGAIGRASWVRHWLDGQIEAARTNFLSWSRAGGQVLPGLRSRREREWRTLTTGAYTHSSPGRPASEDAALRTTFLRVGDHGPAVETLQRDLAKIGTYDGPADGVFDARVRASVVRVQEAHPDLTVDGVAGPATLSQIRRMIESGKKITGGLLGGGGGAVGGGGVNEALGDQVTGLATSHVVIAIALVAAVVVGYLIWRYRDEIQAWSRMGK